MFSVNNYVLRGRNHLKYFFGCIAQYLTMVYVMRDMNTKILKLALLLLLALLVASPLQARKKPKYEITFTINKGRDSVMYMGYYFAKGNSVIQR